MTSTIAGVVLAFAGAMAQAASPQIAAYHAQSDGHKVTAFNDANGFSLEMSAAGLAMRAADGSAPWSLSLRLSSFGYGEVQTPVDEGIVGASRSRVEIRRDAQQLVEWFVNRPRGLEHGFTLGRRPRPAGTALLRFQMTLAGDLKAGADEHGRGIRLAGAAAALRYDKLKVWDAAGTVLPARLLAPDPRELWIEVDDADAVYPITVDPEFTKVDTLTPVGGILASTFGRAIAVSGDTLVVGHDYNGQGSHGAAHVYVRTTDDGWELQQALTPSDGAANDGFGWKVAISGDTIAVTNRNPSAGKVYVYTRAGGVWTERQILPTSRSGLHMTVDLEGNTIVVGSPGLDATQTGDAQVWARDGTAWTLQQHLVPEVVAPNTAFGNAVAISGEWIVVGEYGRYPGRAHLFERTGGTWTRRQTLLSTAPTARQFGWAVDIEGSTAVVGDMSLLDAHGTRVGMVYVFEREGSTWTERQSFRAGEFPGFGAVAKLGGDLLVVKASPPSDRGGEAGRAFLFERDGTGFVERAYLGEARGVGFDGRVLALGSHGYPPTVDVYELGEVREALVVTVTSDEPNDAESATADECDVDRDEDGRQCTLRAAIELANQRGGGTIHFEIPGSGVPRIDVSTISDGKVRGLPPFTSPITLDATTQPGGWVELVGPGQDQEFEAIGVLVEHAGAGSEVRGLVIHGFARAGIILEADGCRIAGNRIGTDVTGTQWRGNGNSIDEGGVSIRSSDNRIEDNVIAGNVLVVDGLMFSGTQVNVNDGDRNTITGNRIGVGADGRVVPLPPMSPRAMTVYYPRGILLTGNSTQNVVGGGTTVPGICVAPCNIIAGHVVEVVIGELFYTLEDEAVGNAVSGNWIGVDAHGRPAFFDAELPRFDTDSGLIDFGTGSVLSYNRIHAEDEALSVGREGSAVGNLLEGRAEGFNQRGANRAMVDVEGPGAEFRGNTVRSHSCRGVSVEGDDNTVVQNEIYDNPLGGILVLEGTGNVIADNEVYDNGRVGIGVMDYDFDESGAPSAVLARNVVYGYAIGIDLIPPLTNTAGYIVEVPPWGQAFGSDGVTQNDTNDGDDGPNGFLNFPDVLSATYDGTTLGVRGFIEAPISEEADYLVEAFTSAGCSGGSASFLGGQPHGEGEHYVGVGGGRSDDGYADFTLALPGVPAGHTHVSLTATRLDLGATSEFSRCVPLAGTDQVAQADVGPSDMGVVLDAQRATVAVGAPGPPATSAAMAQRAFAAGAGELYVTRYEHAPERNVFARATAIGIGGTPVRPNAVAARYWHVADRNLTAAGGADSALRTFDVCLDTTDVVRPAALRTTVVVRRNPASGGEWVPLDTTSELHGGKVYLCARGLDALGEFGFGGASRRVEVEEWSAAWSPGFHDDFEDGVPSSAYEVACGTAIETGGRLVLTTDTTGCSGPGFEVRPSVLSPGAMAVRAIVSLPTVDVGGATPGRVPPTAQGRVGIAVRNEAGSDAVFLQLRRSNDVIQCVQDPCELDPTFGTAGNDVLYVELTDETGRTISRSFALTVNPSPGEPTLPLAVELELTLTQDGVDLLPYARFRECALGSLPGGTCSPAPLLDLIPVAGPPETMSADGGVLAAADSHVAAFHAIAPGGPFTVRIEDWSVAQAVADDFEIAPLGGVAPYQTSAGVCGAVSVADGALVLDAMDGCPKVSAAFAGSLASEVSTAATLRWDLPERCEQRAVSLSAGPDQANLALVRDADGSLALWLTTEPETGDGPAIPLLARTALSATPESDPALAGVAAIELRVALVDDGGALAPEGGYRLCETSPCDPGIAFTPLEPAGFEPPGTGSACGIDLAERAPPSDGGALAAGVPVGASLSLVPEPRATAAAVAAALALAAVRRFAPRRRDGGS